MLTSPPRIFRYFLCVNAIPQYYYGTPQSHFGTMRLVVSLRKQFGKRLRTLRTEKGFNQLYLGELAGVSEDFISLVERGINTPSFETIEALAAALETGVTTLFTFPGQHSDRQRVRMVRPKKKAAERPKAAEAASSKQKRRKP